MRSIIIAITIVLLVLTSCDKQSQKKVIETDDAPKAIGAYSQGILKGNTLYMSGQIAIDPKSGKINNSKFSDEVNQVMKNIEAVLKKADMQYSDVLSVTVYMTDLSKFMQFNSIYSNYFDKQFPARSVVEVNSLPKNANIEISVIAKY